MKKLVCVLTGLALLAGVSGKARAQSLEDLELKKAEAKRKAALLKKKKKKTFKDDLAFGFLGITETATGINRDRPTVYTLLWFAPQFKYKSIYRLQLNMGLYGYYLERDPNPWDLTDWSLQLSALRLYREKVTKISFSGNLRYYMPTSVKSRNNDSHGALRALFKVTRSWWKLYFGLELMAYYYFSKYATTDPDRWWDQNYMQSNPWATLAQRIIISYAPIKRLTLSFLWTWYQTMDHYPTEPYDGVGSSFVADRPRRNNKWDYSWACIFDVTVNVWKYFHAALGYSIFAPALQNSGADVSYNPFDAKYGQVYLDLMMIY